MNTTVTQRMIGNVDDYITQDIKDTLDDMVELRRRVQHDYRGPLIRFAETVVGLIHEKYNIPEDELRELLMPKVEGDPPHVEEPPVKPKKAAKVTKPIKPIKAAKAPDVLSEDCVACMKIKNKEKGRRPQHTCGWVADGAVAATNAPKAAKEDHGTCVCFPKGVKCEKPARKLEVTGEYAGGWACNACWHCPRCPIVLEETGKVCNQRCSKDHKYQTCKAHGEKWYNENLPVAANPQGVAEETAQVSEPKESTPPVGQSAQESYDATSEFMPHPEGDDLQHREMVELFGDDEEDGGESALTQMSEPEETEQEKKIRELEQQLAGMKMNKKSQEEQSFLTKEFLEEPKEPKEVVEEGGDESEDDMMSKFGWGGGDSDESDESDDESESDGEMPTFGSRMKKNKPMAKPRGFKK